MLGYIILILLQIACAWYGAPFAMKYIPLTGDPRIFAHAAVFAVIVWIVGLVASFVLKDVRMPASSTVASALVGALIGAVIIVVPQIKNAIPFSFHPMFAPLAGAILGYMVRR